jgi:hypothetical protein
MTTGWTKKTRGFEDKCVSYGAAQISPWENLVKKHHAVSGYWARCARLYEVKEQVVHGM